MLKRVLILGNGVSRLKYEDFIKDWEDEIWVCNYAYKEYYKFKNFTRMIGDWRPCNDAVEFRRLYNLKFDIYIRYAGWHNKKFLTHPNEVKKLSIDEEYVRDSGSSFVVQALIEDYDEIYLLGFDLGGPDIYVRHLARENKADWVVFWRKIAKDFGLDKITFIGVNHKEFILSNRPADSYAKLYLKRKNHLYYELKKSYKVLIIGNGNSYSQHLDFVKKWGYEIWVCDKQFTQYRNFPRIDRVGTYHAGFAILAYLFRTKHKLLYDIYTSADTKKYKDKMIYFNDSHWILTRPRNKWSTYKLMIAQALDEGYGHIYVLGFDSNKSKNISYSNTFIGEYKNLHKLYPTEIKHVHFVGIEAPDIKIK